LGTFSPKTTALEIGQPVDGHALNEREAATVHQLAGDLLEDRPERRQRKCPLRKARHRYAGHFRCPDRCIQLGPVRLGEREPPLVGAGQVTAPPVGRAAPP